MRIDVKEINGMEKSVRFEYLRQAEKTLARIKKSSDDESDRVSYPFEISIKSDTIKNKQFVSPEQENVFVKVIANTYNFIDSQMDMLIPGSGIKSINENKYLIPHIHDHLRTVTAKVGKVLDIYESEVQLSTLGLDKEGSTTVLIFETDIQKGLNENVFTQYKNGLINQHSIGLRYVDLQLAINDEADEKHFMNWNKYIGQAINPIKAIDLGYFWIVKEYKLIENSAVLFAANGLTNTLETRSNDELQLPEAGNVPPQADIEPQSIALTKLINDFKL